MNMNQLKETKTILVRIRLVAESVPCAIESIVDETGTENNKCRFCVIMAISLAETYDPTKCNFFDATQTSVKGFLLKWKNKIFKNILSFKKIVFKKFIRYNLKFKNVIL